MLIECIFKCFYVCMFRSTLCMKGSTGIIIVLYRPVDTTLFSPFFYPSTTVPELRKIWHSFQTQICSPVPLQCLTRSLSEGLPPLVSIERGINCPLTLFGSNNIIFIRVVFCEKPHPLSRPLHVACLTSLHL